MKLREHTTFSKNEDETVTAVFVDDGKTTMATGETESEALKLVAKKLRGERVQEERPWLRLCVPCNRRMAKVEEMNPGLAEVKVDLCEPCSKTLDRWKEAHAKWVETRKRKARNKRKRQRKNRRR